MDIKGTTQENIAEEVAEIAKKKITKLFGSLEGFENISLEVGPHLLLKSMPLESSLYLCQWVSLGTFCFFVDIKSSLMHLLLKLYLLIFSLYLLIFSL